MFNWVLLVALLGLNVLHAQAQDTLAAKQTTRWWRTPFPAHLHEDGTMKLRNEEGTFGRKLLRGSGLCLVSTVFVGGMVAAIPSEISGWPVDKFSNIGPNLRRAYTSPPVFDTDHWYFNYVAHPYVGMTYYNAVRSQKATILQSSLFTLGNVLIWEYVLEATMEQPSIQDLIITPVAGILLGELTHRATMALARKGFLWYEAIPVILFNPMFVVNNGLRFPKRQRKK